jgi:hypothetical protein
MSDTKKTVTPKNLAANAAPTDGYAMEIDGKMKSQYKTAEEAMKASLELKGKFPHIQIKVFGAKERTRTLVELPGQ